MEFVKNPIVMGFIQLPTDFTLDIEIHGMLSQIDNVIWRLQKLPFIEKDGYNITSEMYHNIKKNIQHTASIFLPHPSNGDILYGTLKVISLACTSMSFVLTPDTIHKEMYAGYPTVTNDMASSVLNSINSLYKYKCNDIGDHIPKIALLTPYIQEVHQKNINYFRENGCRVVVDKNLNFPNDMITSSLSPDSIVSVVSEMMEGIDKLELEIDVFVIGCSAFRATSYGFIDKLESKFNTFFVTSNQAMIWNSLHKALENDDAKNCISTIKGYGKLFNCQSSE